MGLEESRFQYRIREPYVRPGDRPYRLDGKVLGPKDSVVVISRMDGHIYVDGPRIEIPFPRGAVVKVTLDSEPIHLVR